MYKFESNNYEFTGTRKELAELAENLNKYLAENPDRRLEFAGRKRDPNSRSYKLIVQTFGKYIPITDMTMNQKRKYWRVEGKVRTAYKNSITRK